MADLSMSAPAGNTTPPAVEPSDLDVAISVARDMLAAYAGVDHGDIFALNQAHGAIREALRILLRALSAEPQTEEEKARHFVDRHFPEVAAFLARERGERQ
ncbi:hypothetical protein ACFC08_35635 [Streptomyces sp. NPDC056112]|uniref:hypothetical protein n=1 Tax=Streptomyces sp. NPDC056112 TaxID=3345715 RepID=UPI0035D7AC3D